MPLTLSGDGSITGAIFNRPAFRVLRTNDLNINNNTVTTVTYNSVEIDTGNCFNTSNGRFTPNEAGYYFVFASISLSAELGARLGDAEVYLRKNGTVIALGQLDGNSSFPDDTVSPVVSGLIQMNGSTDYLDVAAKIIVTSSVPQIEGSSSGMNYFHGFKLAI